MSDSHERSKNVGCNSKETHVNASVTHPAVLFSLQVCTGCGALKVSLLGNEGEVLNAAD